MPFIDLRTKHRRIRLKKTETRIEPTVYLADQLGCRLSDFAVKHSIKRQNTSKLKTRISKVLLVTGGLLTLASISYAMLSYSTFLNDPIKSRFDWALVSLLAIGFSTLPIFAGRVILKTENTRAIPTLQTFTNGGFETEAMQSGFHDFLSWANPNKPHIGFELSNNRVLPLPETIWSSPDLAAIIFGTEANRRLFLSADNFALSALIISARVWSRYTQEKAATEQLSKEPPALLQLLLWV